MHSLIDLVSYLCMILAELAIILTTEGSILPTRVTLGARLCTTEELTTENRSEVSEKRKNLEFNLTTKVTAASAAGIDSGYNQKKGSTAATVQSQAAELSSMTLKTQGGNGLLAAR